jgi:hypothetical protein
MAFCISSGALANLLVSTLIPTPHAGAAHVLHRFQLPY